MTGAFYWDQYEDRNEKIIYNNKIMQKINIEKEKNKMSFAEQEHKIFLKMVDKVNSVVYLNDGDEIQESQFADINLRTWLFKQIRL